MVDKSFQYNMKFDMKMWVLLDSIQKFRIYASPVHKYKSCVCNLVKQYPCLFYIVSEWTSDIISFNRYYFGFDNI